LVFSFLAIALTVRPASSAEPADSKPLAARVQHSDKVPADVSPWGSLQWLMNAKIEPGAGLTLGVVELKAGQSNPRHVHGNCEEVIYVLSGVSRHQVGKESVTLRPGDVLRIPAGVPHMATALGNEPSRSIVVYNSGQRQFTPVAK
jgi:quercetin dioxygenase-like cupin family protein